jgi:hypothetical protein
MQPEAIDMEAIQEALQRRKDGTLPPVPQGQPMPQDMPMGQEAPMPMEQGMPAPVSAGLPPQSDESTLIVKGLIDRLKQFGKTA